MAAVTRGSPEEKEAQRKARAEFERQQTRSASTTAKEKPKGGALAGLRKINEVLNRNRK